MNVKWTKGMSQEEVDEFRSIFDASLRFRQRFIEVIKSEKELKQRTNLSDKEYENASWAYKQADNIGYMRAIEDILAILK